MSAPETAVSPGEDVDDLFDVEYRWDGEEGETRTETIQVDGNTLLLEAGLQQGFDLNYVCRTGFCGVCLARTDGDAAELVDMSINQVELLTDEAVEAGYFLPCTSRPRAEITVDQQVGPQDLEAFQEPDEEDEEDDEEDEDDEENDIQAAPVHAIDYVEQQWTIEVPQEQNLLEAGEERGFDLPYFCREGYCGECLAQVDGDANELVEMTVNDYDPLDEDAMTEGYVLTCTGQPRDAFALETGKSGELD